MVSTWILVMAGAAGAVLTGAGVAWSRRNGGDRLKKLVEGWGQDAGLRLQHDDGDRFTGEALTNRGVVAVTVEPAKGGQLAWLLVAPVVGVPLETQLNFAYGEVTGGPDDARVAASSSDAVERARQAIFGAPWSVEHLNLSGSSLTLEMVAAPHPSADGLLEQAGKLLDVARALSAALGDGGAQRACPLCRTVALTPGVGPLGESVCPSCAGRLLEPDAVRRVVMDEMGLEPGDLKEAAAGAQGAGAVCPACLRAMAPVLLSDVIVDLCTGCGAMWLDADELKALSLGRYEG